MSLQLEEPSTGGAMPLEREVSEGPPAATPPRDLSHCVCGQTIFFGNMVCVACGRALGFDPSSGRVHALLPIDGEPGYWNLHEGEIARKVRQCANTFTPAACNWVIEASLPDTLCISCALTRTLPNLSNPDNGVLWSKIELEKRRLVAALLSMRLPLDGMEYHFLETIPGAPRILTGHSDGIITLNIEEADDAVRERVRSEMREPYRTLLGHFRHESGHFYWMKLIENTPLQETFRKVFGDERIDYDAALQNYHAQGATPDWQGSFVSAYATSHPHEDWAETWAHYLHMREGLESAGAMGVAIQPERLCYEPFPDSALLSPEDPTGEKFLSDLNRWCALSTVVNELNRSMGQPDFYPFVLSQAIVRKLHFVHLAITAPHSNMDLAEV